MSWWLKARTCACPQTASHPCKNNSRTTPAWPQRRFSPDTLAASASNSSLARTLGQLAAGGGAGGAPAPGHVMFNRHAEGAARDSGPANGVMVRCTPGYTAHKQPASHAIRCELHAVATVCSSPPSPFFKGVAPASWGATDTDGGHTDYTNGVHKRGQTSAEVRMLQAQDSDPPARCAAQGYGAQQGFLLLHTVPGFPMAPPHHRAGTPHTFTIQSTHGSRIHAHQLFVLVQIRIALDTLSTHHAAACPTLLWTS